MLVLGCLFQCCCGLFVYAIICASFGFACQSCCVCLFTYGCLIFVVVLFNVFVFVCLSKVSYKVLVGLSMLL